MILQFTMRTILWTLGSLVHLAFSSHVVHEKRLVDPTDHDWTLARRLESHKVFRMRIGLVQRNLHLIDELVMSVSHPDSPTYGQHWSAEKVLETFAPADSSVSAVKDWLSDEGLQWERIKISPNRGWIEVNVTAAEAERLLQTEYNVYSHSSGVEQIGRIYSLCFVR